MGVIAQIALGVLAIAFMTFIAFFGRLPALRHTPVAWLHRVIWVAIPSWILTADGRLSGGRITAWAGRTGHFVLYGRHPTVLIFFLALLGGGEVLFLPGAWPRLSAVNRVGGALAIALPYLFLWLSARADPGTVTAASLPRQLAHYPYDYALFHPGQTCRTCGLPKPARSKHCGVCGRCVHRMDHHCVFINNCVGYHNQRWFLLLLLSTAVLTAYGAAVGLSLVSASVRQRRPAWSLWKPAAAVAGKPLSWPDWLLLFTVGVQDDVGIGSVTLLMLMTSPLVWGLLGYHVYLIYCGTTTNESMKWQDWQAEMAEGCAFKRALLPPSPSPAPSPAPADDRQRRRGSPRATATAAAVGVPRTRTRWPVEPVQVLVRTENGRPPAVTSGPGVGDWERVWKLRDVENLYDLGFWDNLIDVFVPDYPFRDEEEDDDDDDDDDGGGGAEKPMGKPGTMTSSDLETGSKNKRKTRRNMRIKVKKTRKPKTSAAASLVNAAT
ncbi:palmitoyltransferase swf1 [Diatrype stigma]|uniref:Palmitoyltransferase n=1 Tax=Diatrype stigma TaxID=117547 RepID=A0AAN9U9Y1_9PEZI